MSLDVDFFFAGKGPQLPDAASDSEMQRDDKDSVASGMECEDACGYRVYHL